MSCQAKLSSLTLSSVNLQSSFRRREADADAIGHPTRYGSTQYVTVARKIWSWNVCSTATQIRAATLLQLCQQVDTIYSIPSYYIEDSYTSCFLCFTRNLILIQPIMFKSMQFSQFFLVANYFIISFLCTSITSHIIICAASFLLYIQIVYNFLFTQIQIQPANVSVSFNSSGARRANNICLVHL